MCSKMHDRYCVVGCSNQRSETSTLKSFKIPFRSEDSLKLTQKWVIEIKREKQKIKLATPDYVFSSPL